MHENRGQTHAGALPAASGALTGPPPTPGPAPAPGPLPGPSASLEEAILEEVLDSPPRHSESLVNLIAALTATQGTMQPAVKGSKNPFHKNSYADLASCWDACREPLHANGLAVVQLPWRRGRRSMCVTTRLMHSSGEWIESDLTLTAGTDTAQALCGLVTYARRYALSGTVGISSEDDDGNSANRPPDGVTWQPTPPSPTPVNRPEPKPRPDPKAPAQPAPTTGAASPEAVATAGAGAVSLATPVPPPPGKPPMRAPGTTPTTT
jgi:hypothetical protein